MAVADISVQVWFVCQGKRQDAQERKAQALHWTCGYPGAEESRSPTALQEGERQVKSSVSVHQTSNEARLYASNLSVGKYLITSSQGQTVSQPGSRHPALTRRAPSVSRRAAMKEPTQVLHTGSIFRRDGLRARCGMQWNGASSPLPNFARLGATQRMNSELGRCEIHIRHVECVGGGARGLGFLLTLRFGYQGSSRLRRLVAFAPLSNLGDVVVCESVLVRERKPRVVSAGKKTRLLTPQPEVVLIMLLVWIVAWDTK